MSKFLIASVALLMVVGVGFAQEKPMISVYYESLCPDSIRFVTKQLWPTFKPPTNSFYKLKLIPYGKSQLIRGDNPTNWEFACHHGPRECYGNKVHGCALEQVHDQETSLRFIVCLMEKTLEDKNAPYPVEECASKSNVNARDIIQCANYTAGNEVLKRNQEETDRLMNPLSNVPTIVFNNKFDKQIQEMSVDNFMMALCKNAHLPANLCQHISGAVGLTAATIISIITLTFAPLLL